MEAKGRSKLEEQCSVCQVDRTGCRPAAKGSCSLPSVPCCASEQASAMEPVVLISVQLVFVLKYNSEPPHIPSPSRCILRRCVIRQHSQPRPSTPAGQEAPHHIQQVHSRVRSRIRPAAHTSSRHTLRACSVRHCSGSMIASSPPDQRYAHLLDSLAVAMASSRPPSPRPRCFPHRRHTNSLPLCSSGPVSPNCLRGAPSRVVLLAFSAALPVVLPTARGTGLSAHRCG